MTDDTGVRIQETSAEAETARFFAVRPVQGKVKHTILRQYAGAWAGIILNGVRRDAARALEGGRRLRVDLVYIDGFAGAGQYRRDFDGTPGPIWGSPIIGVQALEEQAAKAPALDVRVSAFLTEQKAECYEALMRNLSAAGLRTPVQAVPAFTRDGLGLVNVLRGDFREQIPALTALLGAGAGADPFVLTFIDPFGPAMRMRDMHAILGRARTDAVVLFPHHVHKVRSGSALKAKEARQPMEDRNLDVSTANFGTDAWLEIAARPGITVEEQEAEWAALYGQQLRAADARLIVKNIPLQLGEIERTAYHLWIVTRDEDGAMKMNDVLRGAEVDEQWIRWRGQEEREQAALRAAVQTTLDFGGPALPPPAVVKRSYTPEEVARTLQARLGGRTVPLKKGVYHAMADTLYTAGEIHKGLRLLRDRGEAEYDGLTAGSALVTVRPPGGAPVAVRADRATVPGAPPSTTGSLSRAGRGPAGARPRPDPR
jgi:three-Cys-motif partner protein